MAKVKRLPPRSKVKKSDTWDLSRLFRSDAAWERAFAEWSGWIDQPIVSEARSRHTWDQAVELVLDQLVDESDDLL